MNRKELDAFVEHYQLSQRGVEAALDAANARPSAHERREFARRLLLLAGVLSLASGVVFLVAANWDAFAIYGRFALVEIALVVAVALALWRPPPAALGRYALLLAFILSGALLALFGQTYQTGADTYELFLGWALLGLPFAVAGRWSVTWAAWLLVLNVAFALFFGWNPATGLLWVLFAGFDRHPALLLLLPMIVDVIAWLFIERLQSTRVAPVAPRWLGRFALACGVGFGAWGGALAIVNGYSAMPGSIRAVVLLVLFGALIGIGAQAVRARSDLFPLAAVTASGIFLSTLALGVHLDVDATARFFMLAVWLIASSTFCSQLLMKQLRGWRAQGIDA